MIITMPLHGIPVLGQATNTAAVNSLFVVSPEIDQQLGIEKDIAAPVFVQPSSFEVLF